MFPRRFVWETVKSGLSDSRSSCRGRYPKKAMVDARGHDPFSDWSPAREAELRVRRSRPSLRSAPRPEPLPSLAIVLPVIMLIILGILDFGRAYNYKNDLTSLSNQALRYAEVNSCAACGGSSIENFIPTTADSPELRNGGSGVGINQGATITFCVPDRLCERQPFYSVWPGGSTVGGEGDGDVPVAPLLRLRRVHGGERRDWTRGGAVVSAGTLRIGRLAEVLRPRQRPLRLAGTRGDWRA